MKSIKLACLFSSGIVISAFLLAAVKPDSIVGKWRMVTSAQEKMERDADFKLQLQSVDTMTKFPEDFLAIKEEFAKMDAETKAQVQQGLVDMLLIDDLEVLKSKMKEQLIARKNTSDSLEKNRIVIYNFRNDNVIEFYTADNIANKDTSTAFREYKQNKRLVLIANTEEAKASNPKDTMEAEILYLSADSLSINIKFDWPEEEFVLGPDSRIINFKAYKD